MADRRKGLTWLDGVLLVLALLGVSYLLDRSAPPEPFIAVLVVLVTAVVVVGIVCRSKKKHPWTVRYLTAFLLAMVFATVAMTEQVVDLPRWVELPALLLVASVPVAVSYVKSDRGSAYRWLAFAMFLGLMVAMFSGSAGTGEATISWMQAWFGWTLEQAEVYARVFRKSVHVVFYALIFLSMARAAWEAKGKWSLSLLAGFVWATGHAVFDETVQSFYDDRSGSVFDYLIDAGGMGIALVLCWLLWGRKGLSER